MLGIPIHIDSIFLWIPYFFYRHWVIPLYFPLTSLENYTISNILWKQNVPLLNKIYCSLIMINLFTSNVKQEKRLCKYIQFIIFVMSFNKKAYYSLHTIAPLRRLYLYIPVQSRSLQVFIEKRINQNNLTEFSPFSHCQQNYCTIDGLNIIQFARFRFFWL